MPFTRAFLIAAAFAALTTAATAETLCAGRGTDDTTRPIPKSLTKFAETLFAPYETEEILYRCVDDQVLMCAVGNGFNCDKPDMTKSLPDIAQYCRETRNEDFVPMSISGHATDYIWACRNGKAKITGARKRDDRGFRAEYWIPVRGVK